GSLRRFWENGGPDQVRTDDLLNAIEALFQLSYEPIQNRGCLKLGFSRLNARSFCWNTRSNGCRLPANERGLISRWRRNLSTQERFPLGLFGIPSSHHPVLGFACEEDKDEYGHDEVLSEKK